MRDFAINIPNIVGIIGVILTIVAYYWLSINKISSTSLLYVLLNLIGSALILFSLFFYWNLASVIIELAWIFISLIGLYKVVKQSRLG